MDLSPRELGREFYSLYSRAGLTEEESTNRGINMASPAALLERVPNKFTKQLTFTGAAGAGAAGTVAVGTVTGQILILHAAGYCSVDLAGAATLELGVAGDTAGVLPQIADATALDAGEFWEATPSKIAAAIVDKVVNGNLIATVGSTDITAGVVDVTIYWLPLSADGMLA